MSLFFANHGRTELCGTGTILPATQNLSVRGLTDGVITGRSLKRQLGAVPLDYILTSPTTRAHLTGDLAGGIVAFGGEIEEDPRLEPRRVPEAFIGQPGNSIPWNNSEALDTLGVEPVESVRERTVDLLREFAGFTGSALLIGDDGTLQLLAQITRLQLEHSRLPYGQALNIGGTLQLV